MTAADGIESAAGYDVPAPIREQLGRLVRLAWIDWARHPPNPKPSWLVPWEELAEPDREVARQIGVLSWLVGRGRACVRCGWPLPANYPAASGVWPHLPVHGDCEGFQQLYRRQLTPDRGTS